MKGFDSNWLANRNHNKKEPSKHKGRIKHEVLQKQIHKENTNTMFAPGSSCKFKSNPNLEIYAHNWKDVVFIIQNRIDEYMNAKHYISYNVTVIHNGETIGQDRISETQIKEI
jgi:hypothetical protein